jgi:hypothetical protein
MNLLFLCRHLSLVETQYYRETFLIIVLFAHEKDLRNQMHIA